ncbi:MAG: helix-turn-helix transcriptional regulator [Sandaracinaceae bacterium]|nr:helix-turn-helix transcriptional regulator [Sandaracinaceae bacterium]
MVRVYRRRLRVQGASTVLHERGYRVVERSRCGPRRLALTEREVTALAMTIDGAAGKQVAHSLGVSPGSVTRILTGIAARLGLASRAELVCVASRIRSTAPVVRPKLTPAEERVLALVGVGLTNAAIARARGTSVRTVANQVSSILEKTGRPTRRTLAALVV